ncbi:hypothetical protein QCE80_16525, partial [Staphylococcus aureus]|nr:hypothetical protein [Staphylococcus aureus]
MNIHLQRFLLKRRRSGDKRKKRFDAGKGRDVACWRQQAQRPLRLCNGARPVRFKRHRLRHPGEVQIRGACP